MIETICLLGFPSLLFFLFFYFYRQRHGMGGGIVEYLLNLTPFLYSLIHQHLTHFQLPAPTPIGPRTRRITQTVQVASAPDVVFGRLNGNIWIRIQDAALGDARTWPQHYRQAFWSRHGYHSRLLVSTFSYNNGLSIQLLIEFVAWLFDRQIDRRHYLIRTYIRLYEDFENNPRMRARYYAWDVLASRVTYLDGITRRSSKFFNNKKRTLYHINNGSNSKNELFLFKLPLI